MAAQISPIRVRIGSGEDFVHCAPSDVGKRKGVSGLFGGWLRSDFERDFAMILPHFANGH